MKFDVEFASLNNVPFPKLTSYVTTEEVKNFKVSTLIEALAAASKTILFKDFRETLLPCFSIVKHTESLNSGLKEGWDSK